MNTIDKPGQPVASEEKEAPIEELFLLHLRYKEARLVETGGNQPILLDDPSVSWVVYRGRADIFAVSLENGRIAGARTHLFRVHAGQAILGMNSLSGTTNNIALLVVGSQHTNMLQIPTHRLRALGQDDEFQGLVADLLDRWVNHLSACLTTDLPPKECQRLEVGPHVNLTKKGSVCAKQGVLWVKHIVGSSLFAGEQGTPYLNGKMRWPISRHSWIQAIEESKLDLISTSEWIIQDLNWPDLEHFHQRILQRISQQLQQTAQKQKDHLSAKLLSDQEIVDQAFNHLASLLSPTIMEPRETHNAYIEACQLVGDRLGIKITLSPHTNSATPSLPDIARASRFQIRQVALKGSWWKEDNGPLLALVAAKGQPVALLPHKKGYYLHNPSEKQKVFVTSEVADTLHPFAFMCYRPFPARLLTTLELIKFGLAGEKGDLQRVILTGLGLGLLGLLVPLATGFIIDQIIPDSDRTQLIQLSVLLLLITGVTASLRIVQNLAILRLQHKLGFDLQAAVWDRVLSLPASFFRNYSAGDLGNRVLGISVIQQTLSGTVLNAMLAGVFSIFSFLLLFYYDSKLALAATGLVALSVAVTLVAGLYQVRYQRVLTETQGAISSQVLQAIEGITKFRAAGAEGRAFATWAKKFSHFKQVGYQSRNVANNLQVFNAGYQVITTMTIFGIVAFSVQQGFSAGQFLAFNVAFIQFLTAVLILSGTLVAVLNIVPVYERARPILQTAPEYDELREHPGKLVGGIEVSHVTFRYDADGPLILKDISMQIEPGEFVAIVGPSGSGKSTLFRLLLGFETPTSGAIYYDKHDLVHTDVREVRRQIGVVLQNGQISSGSIFKNIVGSSILTVKDAWHAAEMAGLKDEIKAMPMGINTVLSQGGGTLSGGQRQRLLIARAIVNKPRILYFDEATSALDNRTQSVVSESLEGLQATRIVIAHRLSTIANADRIYVLDKGQIVQQGTYKQLMKEEGLFADLAKRQVV